MGVILAQEDIQLDSFHALCQSVSDEKRGVAQVSFLAEMESLAVEGRKDFCKRRKEVVETPAGRAETDTVANA